MVGTLLASALKATGHLQASDNAALVSRVAACTFQMLIEIVALLWLHMEVPFSAFPYKLLELIKDPDIACQKILLEEFLSAPTCCLEPQMAVKLQAHHANPESFLCDTGLMGALQLWGADGKVTNMAVERLLSLVNRSWCQGHTPALERIIANGILTQFLARSGEKGVSSTSAEKMRSWGCVLQQDEHKKMQKLKSSLEGRGGRRAWNFYADTRKPVAGFASREECRPERTPQLCSMGLTIPPSVNQVS